MSACARPLVLLTLFLCGCASLGPPETDVTRRVMINGAQLTYVEEGSGETVVLLHGSATDHRIFDSVRRRLARDFRVVAYSRRHHAPNTWPDGGSSYTLTQHADDLVGLIRALGVDRAHVVAVSMGARVAAHAAVGHPEVVRTLTLSDGFLAPPASDEGKRAMDELASQFEKMFARIRAGDDAGAVAAYVDIASPPAGWSGLSLAWQGYYADNARTLSLAARDATLRPPSCEAFRALPIPVLVISGERSPPAIRETNRGLLDCLASGAEHVVVPRAAHYWYTDNPDDGARLLKDFLRRHRRH